MAKQILIGITERELSEIAHYLMIYFPYNEEMCSYTDAWMGELYENKYPLVAKGMWSGIIDLKTHKLLNWKPEYGDLYLQAKICDSGTYFLLDKDKKVICLKSATLLKSQSVAAQTAKNAIFLVWTDFLPCVG